MILVVNKIKVLWRQVIRGIRKSEINGLEKDLFLLGQTWMALHGLHAALLIVTQKLVWNFQFLCCNTVLFSLTFTPNQVSDALATLFCLKRESQTWGTILCTFQIISTMVENCSVQGQIQGAENKECQQWNGEEMLAKSRKRSSSSLRPSECQVSEKETSVSQPALFYMKSRFKV